MTSWAISLRGLCLFSLFLCPVAHAVDHDDGENDVKSRQVNITDVYAFTERSLNPAAAYNQLILILNTSPRSLPKQQYYFSSNARYEFHLSRVRSDKKTQRPIGVYDVVLRVEFSEPGETTHQQNMTLTAIRTSKTTASTSFTPAAGYILTTPLGTAPINNTVTIDDTDLTVFAGLREDPTFFDVKAFFKMRGALYSSHGTSIGAGFSAAATAEDFAAGYNVNSIVLRVPRTFLQRVAEETIFDVWGVVKLAANAL